MCCGGVLLSHNLSVAVPSALPGLASRFGMCAGRFPGAVTTTRLCVQHCSPRSLFVCGGCGLIVVCIVVAACVACIVSPLITCLGCLFSVGPLVPVGSRAPAVLPPLAYLPASLAGASHPTKGAWKPHLEAGFPLRCFQRLSLPNVANQPCTWRYNWHTRGSSIPVLSY